MFTPRRRFGWAFEIDWSVWAIGFEVDGDRHWSRNLFMYAVTVYIGPLIVVFHWDSKEYN